MRYMLAVEVKLIEVPDAPEIPAMRAGDDPIAGMTKVLGAIAVPAVRPHAFIGGSAGFDFRKETEISVPGFSGLAAIIGRFDELVSDIEHERLQV